MNHRHWLALAAVLLGYLLVASTVVLVTPIGTAEGQSNLSREERNWEFMNHNRFGTNHNPQTQINKETAQYIELKWVAPIPSTTQFGAGSWGDAEGSQAPQLVVDGIVFNVLNRKSILAYDAKDGSVVWQWEHPEYDQDQGRKDYPIAMDTAHTHGMYFSDGFLVQTDFGCKYTFNDPKTGEVAKQLLHLCVENTNAADGWYPASKLNEAGWGLPTNSGEYRSRGTHPPSTWVEENLIYHQLGGHAEGTYGGRFFASARTYDTGELVWRTFLQPPCGDPTTCGPGKDGPLFVEEKAAWGDWLVASCDKIWVQQIKSCDMPRDILQNDWGDMRSNSGISNVWGQSVVDEETGILYFGTAQPGPDWNASYSPGPRLFGSAVVALNADNGELIWAHQTTARDLWDYDCSWNTMLTTTVVKGVERKVVIKGCKNGIVYVLDAATGEALHLLEPPSIKRTPHAQLLDPMSREDMLKPWQNAPDTGPTYQNCWGAGCLEADIVFDEGRNMLFFGTYNAPFFVQMLPVENRGDMGINFGAAAADWFTQWLEDTPELVNATINAYDVDTGELKWEYHMLGTGFRGGVIVSGGVVWMSSVDGFSTALDADTGEVLYKLNMGLGSSVMPTVAADSNGDIKLFRPQGAGFVGNANWGPGMTTSPGAIMVYGLPDVIPEPEVIIEEVEVEVEKIVEVEKEVEVTVIEEVTVETISPISYVIIGLGIVAIIIAGVLYQRTRRV